MSGAISILLIEDVDAMRHFLEVTLRSFQGVRAVTAVKNGWEARRQALRDRPDLVLLDEILPGESSLDLLRELNRQGIPVLLMTGVQEPEHAVPPEARARVIKPAWEEPRPDLRPLEQAIRKAVGASQNG